MKDVFGSADDEALLAPERDPHTGRRIPSSRSRQNKQRDDPRPRIRTKPKMLVGAGIALVVVVAAAGVAIAASGGDGSKHPVAAGGANANVTSATPRAGIPTAPTAPTANLITVVGVIEAPGDFASGCQGTILRTAAGARIGLGQDVQNLGFGVPNISPHSPSGVAAILTASGQAVANIGDKVTIKGRLWAKGPGSDPNCRLATETLLVAKVTKG